MSFFRHCIISMSYKEKIKPLFNFLKNMILKKPHHLNYGWEKQNIRSLVDNNKINFDVYKSQCVNVTASFPPPNSWSTWNPVTSSEISYTTWESPGLRNLSFYHYYRYDPRNSARLSSQAMSSGRGVNIPKCPQSAAYMPQVSDFGLCSRRAGLLQLNLTLQG